MKLVPDGWVYTYTGPPFSKWNPSWSARCRICDTVVTKYDHTEDEAVALLASHVRSAHRRLCAHADLDGDGMHWLEPGERCDDLACGPVGSTAPADPHTSGFDTDQP